MAPSIVLADHPIVAGLPQRWPRLLGYNRFSSKPGGSCCRANRSTDPLIVAGAFGKGRSVAFASDCGPHWAPPEFVDWEGYAPLWRQIAGWDGRASMIAPLNVMQWGDPAANKTAVALHGITANAGAFARPARLMAERGWRVLAPDLRGHGESPRGDGDFSAASLLQDLARAAPTAPDLLIGHSFGGYLAQVGVLRGLFRPRALALEDPVSHFADRQTPAGMLAWDEAHLPRAIDGLIALNPKWSRLDAAWKLVSLEQIDFKDATAAFAGNAPWDLRPEAARLARMQPTLWILPTVSRFVPDEDQARLLREVGKGSVAIIPDVGHSIHRDAVELFVDAVLRLSKGGRPG